MTSDLRKTLVRFDAHGIRFSYPDLWELIEQQDGDDLVVTVQSEGTCFWAVRLIPSCPSPQDVVSSCVVAFREEFEELDESGEPIALAGMPAVSRFLEFSCLELLNSAMLASVRTSDFTVLAWWQGTDHELRECQSVLELMTDSLQIVSLLDE